MMRILYTALAIGAVCVVSLNAWSQSAQNAAIAEALFREGQELMKANRVHEACEKFAASNQVEPAMGTLLNLAVCHEKEGRSASAWTEYSDVVAKAAEKDREAYARARIKALEGKLSKISITVVNPAPGTEVRLDGNVLPSAAWGSAIPLDPGEHVVEASAPDRAKWTRNLRVQAGVPLQRVEIPGLVRGVGSVPPPLPQEEKVEVVKSPSLENKAQADSKPQAPATKPASVSSTGSDNLVKPRPAVAKTSSPMNTKRVAGYVSAGVGAAALVTAAVLGLSARSSANHRDELCPSGQWCFNQEAFHADHQARVKQNWGIVTALVGVAAAGTGTYLILTTRDQRVAPKMELNGGGRETGKKDLSSQNGWWISPTAGFDGLGLCVGGNW